MPELAAHEPHGAFLAADYGGYLLTLGTFHVFLAEGRAFQHFLHESKHFGSETLGSVQPQCELLGRNSGGQRRSPFRQIDVDIVQILLLRSGSQDRSREGGKAFLVVAGEKLTAGEGQRGRNIGQSAVRQEDQRTPLAELYDLGLQSLALPFFSFDRLHGLSRFRPASDNCGPG